MSFERFLGLLIVLAVSATAAAEQATLAVAANFADTARAVARMVEVHSDHEFRVVSGSTGKLYAQITNGAPFDAFLAADVERPKRLEEDGRIEPMSRFTYALGTLTLWCPNRPTCDEQTLRRDDVHHLAVANPTLAPYGAAARETLSALGLREQLEAHLVRGENVAQAFHFVIAGGADLGLVSLAQVKKADRGSHWIVPANLYQPITQQAVLLTNNPAAAEFLRALANKEARRIITNRGFGLPPVRAVVLQ